ALLRTFQEVTDLFKVLAQDFFFAGVAQDVGRVDGGKRLGAGKVIELAADFGDAFLDAQHGADGGRAQAANQARLDGFNLAIEEGRAGIHFILFRRAISRWAALDDVEDVNVYALQA